MATFVHVVVGAGALGLAILYARGLRADGRRWALAWCGYLAAFGGLAVVSSGLGALWVRPLSVFTFLRFLAQVAFGELPLLTGAFACAHLARQARRDAALLSLVPILLVGVYWDAYHVEPWSLQVRTHALTSAARTAGGRRDGGTRHLRVVHLSDIQTFAVRDYEARALRAALALRPDLIVMTGDYLQRRLPIDRPLPTAEFRALLLRERFTAPHGVYAVPGDVDHRWPEPLDGTGVTCLSDADARVVLPGGARLAIVGLRVQSSRGRDPDVLSELMRRSSDADLRIVIGHRPEFVRPLARDQVHVDLALAGHTHGGQVVLPFFGPLITKSSLGREYAGGLARFEGVPLHVSRGVGMERGTAPQLRWLCPPEVCLLDIVY